MCVKVTEARLGQLNQFNWLIGLIIHHVGLNEVNAGVELHAKQEFWSNLVNDSQYLPLKYKIIIIFKLKIQFILSELNKNLPAWWHGINRIRPIFRTKVLIDMLRAN